MPLKYGSDHIGPYWHLELTPYWPKYGRIRMIPYLARPTYESRGQEPRSNKLPFPTIRIDCSSDTTAPKSWRVGFAAFHADLSAATVAAAIALPSAMPCALACAHWNCHRPGMGGVLEEK
jgi:hypothetical protein